MLLCSTEANRPPLPVMARNQNDENSYANTAVSSEEGYNDFYNFIQNDNITEEQMREYMQQREQKSTSSPQPVNPSAVGTGMDSQEALSVRNHVADDTYATFLDLFDTAHSSNAHNLQKDHNVPVDPHCAIIEPRVDSHAYEAARINSDAIPTTAVNNPLPTHPQATDHATLSSTEKQIPSENLQSAPEPPRWRFAKNAKKSMGYSSLHAGSHIEGQSSDELGAEYVAPDISLYAPKEEKVRPMKKDFELSTHNDRAEEDAQVGKLDANFSSQSASSNRNNKVGKLQINEALKMLLDRQYEGRVAGLSKLEAQPTEERKPCTEWDTDIKLGPKNEPENERNDGNVHGDSYAMPDGEDPSKTHKDEEVGKLEFHCSGSGVDDFVGEIFRNDMDRDDIANHESGDSDDDIREGALFIDNDGSTNNINTRDFGTLTEPVEEDSKKRHPCLYLLLLLILLILVVILGFLVGNKNEEEVVAVKGDVGDLLIPPIIIVNETTVPSSHPSLSLSNKPSLRPSFSPSMECPLGTKPFLVSHSLNSENSLSTSFKHATWKIRDACSGETLAKCLPCSHGNKVKPEQPTLHRLEKKFFKNTTECLPINNQYVVQVLPAKDSELCCGFDLISSIISYDNMVMEYEPQEDGDPLGNIPKYIYFGERETPCKSEPPSTSPTISVSTVPSFSPTPEPSSGPSLDPISIPSSGQPTKSPIVFLGGCPETYTPFSYYTIDAQIESNGIVYKCISLSCGSNMFRPGSSMSSLWREDWEIVGSCQGTLQPTSNPTKPPIQSPSVGPSKEPTPRVRTRRPTTRPALVPTCSTSTEHDFNLCIAIDMSGSICNSGTGSECVDCQSTFLPIFFMSECKDFFVTEDTCCSNFANIKEFSALIVTSLGESSANTSFSVVQFATNAQLVSGLASADQTVPVFGRLDYTGGLTNHASAIQTCQQSFPSEGSMKNYILLITDGVSSQPDVDPEGSAEAAAATAKSRGTSIVPLFISKNNNLSALSFMRRLSSDGKVFDVADFASLNSLQDGLVDQVSCA